MDRVYWTALLSESAAKETHAAQTGTKSLVPEVWTVVFSTGYKSYFYTKRRLSDHTVNEVLQKKSKMKTVRFESLHTERKPHQNCTKKQEVLFLYVMNVCLLSFNFHLLSFYISSHPALYSLSKVCLI